MLACEQFAWQEWSTSSFHSLARLRFNAFTVNIVRKFDPSVPKGDTKWRHSDYVYNIFFDTRNSREILGLTYHNWEDCGRSVMDYYREKGWWGKK